MILPVLLSQAPAVPLSRGFAPNPLEQTVKQGDSLPLEGFATCPGTPAGAVVSRDPVLKLDVGEGIAHLAFQLSERGGWLVARNAAKELSCSHGQVLTVDAKPGVLELFIVTPSTAVETGDMKVKVLDTDGVRELPLSIRRVSVAAGGHIALDGEVASETLPVAQLELAAALENLDWKLTGSAHEVWVTSLMSTGGKAVKAPTALAAGKYAVWIRGAKGAFTATASNPSSKEAESVKVAEAAPAPTPAPSPAVTPAAEPTLGARVLTGVDLESLRGWSREAQAARKHTFMEALAEQFVFAVADGEALLVTSMDGKNANVISADGAEQSMATDELSVKPGSGPRVRAASLPDDVPLAALTTEKDPKLKAFEKQRRSTEACVERVKNALADEDETDALATAAKRCSVAKLEKAKKKLDAELRKAFKRKHATELSQLERHLKALFAKSTEVASSR